MDLASVRCLAFRAVSACGPQSKNRLLNINIRIVVTGWEGILHMKRVFDLTLASLLLVVSAPVLSICMILIRVESPGPAVFRQTRVGLREKRFTCYKLRTMQINTRN